MIKAIFLAAVARPIFDDNCEYVFNGKIGIWPFVECVQAQRNSVKRLASIWEIKYMNVTQ